MNNENLKPVEKIAPFTKMIMSIGALPSSFYSTMSYYESMVWLYEYLKNTVIPTVNNNGEAVEELQEKFKELNEAFNTLQDYIEHYFENLDVQEEINKKLDEMADDGTLTFLIKYYVDPIYESYETEINQKVDGQDTEISNFKLQINNEMNTFKNGVNDSLTTMNTKIDNATSGSPLVASSTAGMTDTSRIYVNSTDGHWYWYDGAIWQDGGVYQATAIDTDQTLSSLGDPADAKVTGKSLKRIENSLKEIYVDSGAEWENGIMRFDTGAIWTGPNMRHITVDISNYINFKVKITGKSNNVSNSYYLAGIFDENDDIIETYGENNETVYTDLEITIPPNASSIVINGVGLNGQNPELKIQNFKNIDTIINPIKTDITNLENNKVKTYYRFYSSNKELRVYIPYISDERWLVYKFLHQGGNNLYDLKGYYEMHTSYFNTEQWDVMVALTESTSDTFSPYLIKAINDPDGDYQSENLQWCGGNHEYTNTGSGGTPTARETYFNIRINNNEIDLTANSDGYCDTIKIEWINYVQASNTKKENGTGREVLKEKHIAEWKNGIWNLETIFTPLEDIIIRRWMAYQLKGTNATFKNILYTSANNRELNDGDYYSNSGSKLTNSIIAYKTATSNNESYGLEMGVDTSYDLGKRDYILPVDNVYYGAYNEDYGKAYFNIIGNRAIGNVNTYDNDLTFYANKDYRVKGYIKFHKDLFNY